MSWCHVCAVEYAAAVPACPECGGGLVSHPAPERRVGASVVAGLVVIATLPPEQAFVATGRLERGGIPSALREAGSDGSFATPSAVHVLVSKTNVDAARSLLRRRTRKPDPSHARVLMGVLLIAGIALFLSAAIFVARWMLNGTPINR